MVIAAGRAIQGIFSVQMTETRFHDLLQQPQGVGVAVCATDWGIIDGRSQSAPLRPSWLWSEADMRVGYFGYYVKHRQSGDKYIVDLRNFVRDFVTSEDVAFKQQFTYNAESLLLLPSSQGSTYLFVQTRDLEIVKRVKRGEWDADDIRRVLRSDQTVGFASYVSLSPEWIGTACRVMSPRHTAFAHLVNSIFDKLQIPFDFILRSFHTQLPEDQVASLDRVGRVSVEINHSSPAMPRVWSALTGGDGTELNDIASMRIEVIPLRKRTADLKPNLQELVDSLPRNGLESLEARAKAEALDRMSDMYIYGAGAVRGFIDVDAESEIPEAMATSARDNADLQTAIQEFRDEPDLESGSNASSLGISWSSAYGRYVDRP